jgi:hypothetical protein
MEAVIVTSTLYGMQKEKANLKELAGLFLKLGLTAFGGPAAHIAMMQKEVADKRQWRVERPAGGRLLFYSSGRRAHGYHRLGIPALWRVAPGASLYLWNKARYYCDHPGRSVSAGEEGLKIDGTWNNRHIGAYCFPGRTG